mgnify:CR=1 FL=1
MKVIVLESVWGNNGQYRPSLIRTYRVNSVDEAITRYYRYYPVDPIFPHTDDLEVAMENQRVLFWDPSKGTPGRRALRYIARQIREDRQLRSP